MIEPAVVRLNDHVDLETLGLPRRVTFYALLGGYCASGSIKDLALHAMLEQATRSGRYLPGTPLAEISNGSMARSVALYAESTEVDAFISFPGITQERLNEICAPYVATALAVEPDPGAVHPLVGYFEAFARRCREAGYFYLDQTRSPGFSAGYTAATGSMLRALERTAGVSVSSLDAIVGAVGTGSSLIGFARGLSGLGLAPSVVGVEPGPRAGALPPWEEIAGLRNTHAFHWSRFGHPDCYDPRSVDVRLEVGMEAARSCLAALEAGGIRASLSAGAALAGALTDALTHARSDSLLIFADAVRL